MKDFCKNQFCENPGAKVVPISYKKPSDQKRTLCMPCEEVCPRAMQHRKINAQAKPILSHLDRFQKNGFVILTRNDGDPSRHSPFEASAYRGWLDLQTAAPLTFGVGTSVSDAIDALELQLKTIRRQVNNNKSRQTADNT